MLEAKVDESLAKEQQTMAEQLQDAVIAPVRRNEDAASAARQ
jgi:hypothetical protein